MKVYEIVEATRGILVSGNKDDEINFFSQDSRQMTNGGMYIPLKGERFDGHNFIESAFQTGAQAIISEKDVNYEDKIVIKVKDTHQALKDMASYLRNHRPVKVVGVTGSVGKTSTKEIIASVLEEKFKVLKTEGNYNNEIGEPLTILKIRDEHEVAVIEMGISDFEEMHRLAKVSRPDVCVITNIGTCHLENLGDRDGVFKAKTEMFDYASKDCFVVLNGDDDKLSNVKEVNGHAPVFFGIDTDRDVMAIKYESLGIQGTKVKIKYFDKELDTVIPIPGYHMIYNAMAAVCIGSHFGMTLDEIDSGIRNLKAIGGRNNIFTTNGITVIDDCYNANPMSMKASINVLSQANGRKVAILGDMFELGETSKELHKEVGQAAVGKVDILVCIGNLSKDIAEAAIEGGCNTLYFPNKADFEENLSAYIKEGDTVLIKASNGMKFKTIVEKLKG